MKSDKKVAVSALADLATCERRVYLRAKFGDRTTKAQDAARAHGEAVHDAAYNQSRPDDKPDGRCFIATCAFGYEAPETKALRSWRDAKLRFMLGGRLAIQAYYLASPWLVACIGKSEFAKSITRKILRWFIRRVSN